MEDDKSPATPSLAGETAAERERFMHTPIHFAHIHLMLSPMHHEMECVGRIIHAAHE